MNSNHRPFSILYFLLKLKAVKNSTDAGYVLVIAVGTIVALTGLLAVYGRSNRIQNIATNSTVDSSSGFFAAEAALNQRAQDIRQIFLNRQVPSGTSPQDLDDCVSQVGSKGTGDLACETITLSASAENRQPYIGATYVIEGERTEGVVPRGDRFQNLSMSESLYSLYALGLKEGAPANEASAILQMDVRAREIPMFQFAAFYKNDLEILPGPTMNLNGPIHTDGSLYLGANDRLNINGQVTVAGQLFSKRKNDNSTYNNGKVRIRNANNTDWIDLIRAGTGSTSATRNAMDPVRIASAYGTQVQVGTDPVSIPTPDILDSTGEYFQKADIRINFNPPATSTGGNFNYLNTIPFSLTAINRTDSSGNLTTPTERVLNARQLRSLRQPVMVGAVLANINPSSPYNVCTPKGLTGSLQTWWNGLSAIQRNTFREQAQAYLQDQIQSIEAPLRLSYMDLAIEDVSSERPNLFGNFASNPSSLRNNNALKIAFSPGSKINTATNRLADMTAQQIAGLPEYDPVTNTPIANTARCYVGAPITDVGRDAGNHLSWFRFYNNRENKDIRILQINLQSMAIWNKDGVFLNQTGNVLTPTDQLLYLRAPEDSDAPAGSFQRLGYGAIDVSDGGMVIHAMVDDSIANAYTDTSRYGFAVVRGQQLIGLGRSDNIDDPTGLTIATDQAIYPQGDYNTVNYQPAGILADSFNPLSNACIITTDLVINRLNNHDCNDLDGDQIDPTPTEFNAAVLAGTDITNEFGSNYNGGLENYPRFLERWGGTLWQYRGSFVSIARPLRVSGRWGQGNVYSAPRRDWDYDQNFNDPRNLPPLTPNFVYLKQDSFFRSFDQ